MEVSTAIIGPNGEFEPCQTYAFDGATRAELLEAIGEAFDTLRGARDLAPDAPAAIGFIIAYGGFQGASVAFDLAPHDGNEPKPKRISELRRLPRPHRMAVRVVGRDSP